MSIKCDRITPHPSKFCSHYIEQDDNTCGFCMLGSEFRCIEDIKHRAVKLSHSAIQAYMQCKMKFWYGYVRGITIKPHMKSKPLIAGGLWDVLHDVIYGEKTEEDAIKYIDKHRIPNYIICQVEALYRAHKYLFNPQLENLVGTQQHVSYLHSDGINGEVIIHGFVDRLYNDHFVEVKLSSRPEYYTQDAFKISSQVGTYFLCNRDLEYVVMEVTKIPRLKQRDDESDDDYEDRLYNDIISRPSFYFQGYSLTKKTFGVKFYRGEFENFIKDAADRYKWITAEILNTAKEGSWYKCESSCTLFGSLCEYYPICSSDNGYASEDRYEIRETRGGKKDESQT